MDFNFPSEWIDTNFYATLGVEPSATPEQIKSEYLWNAKKFHPDLNEGDKRAAERFKKIQQAYEVLSSEEKRKKYDDFLLFSQKPMASTGGQYAHEEPRKSTFKAPPLNDDSSGKPSRSSLFYSVVGLVLGVVILSSIFSSGLFRSDSPATSPPQSTTTAQTPVTPRPTPVSPAPVSRYTANDVKACEDFQAFQIEDHYSTPTTVEEGRALFNGLSLKYEGFFYQADDLILRSQADHLSTLARRTAVIYDLTGEPGIKDMASTGLQSAYNRLWSECNAVRRG